MLLHGSSLCQTHPDHSRLSPDKPSHDQALSLSLSAATHLQIMCSLRGHPLRHCLSTVGQVKMTGLDKMKVQFWHGDHI